jgi:hypothetical protein
MANTKKLTAKIEAVTPVAVPAFANADPFQENDPFNPIPTIIQSATPINRSTVSPPSIAADGPASDLEALSSASEVATAKVLQAEAETAEALDKFNAAQATFNRKLATADPQELVSLKTVLESLRLAATVAGERAGALLVEAGTAKDAIDAAMAQGIQREMGARMHELWETQHDYETEIIRQYKLVPSSLRGRSAPTISAERFMFFFNKINAIAGELTSIAARARSHGLELSTPVINWQHPAQVVALAIYDGMIVPNEG